MSIHNRQIISLISVPSDSLPVSAEKYTFSQREEVKVLKSQKILAIVLVLVAVLVMLTGCSNDTSNRSSVGSSVETPTTSSSNSTNSTSPSSGTSSKSAFTNKYGTATTKCAHSGCDNYIASSGDTNCCTTHSNKCLECGKYIDEDAMYCMSCITNAVTDSSSGSSNSTSSKSSSNSSSGNKCKFKEGGEYVCNNTATSGSNFCSYHQKLLDDAYNDLFGG